MYTYKYPHAHIHPSYTNARKYLRRQRNADEGDAFKDFNSAKDPTVSLHPSRPILSPPPPHPTDEGVDEKRANLEEKLEDKTLVPEIGLLMVEEEEEIVRVVLGRLWGRARVMVLGCRRKHIVC